MSEFDALYTKLMESMLAGGLNSVFGIPTNTVEIGSTGGAVGVNNDKAYAEGDTRLPKSIFGTVQQRPNPRRSKSRKNRRSK